MRIRRSPTLQRHMQIFLPLSAANRRLGVLMLAFDNGHGVTLNGDERKTLATFADQLSIAVHNTQLLQHTSDRLEAKIREEQELRRQIEQMRSNELAEVATALVHRLGHAGDVPMRLEATRKAVSALTAQVTNWSEVALRHTVDDAIIAVSQLAQIEVASEREKIWRHLDHIEKRFQQIQDLSPTLGNVSGLKEMTLEPLDLRTVIERALARFTCHDAITLHCPLPESTVLVEGDGSLLQEAIFSLLENACEAMPEGGWLTIRLQREGDGFVTTYISDSGAGVPDEVRERIFEPGFSTRPAKGSQARRGQGLFVGRAIVRRHGGEVSLYANGAQGATFAFRLPLLNPDL
jgi:signal transduction histidine kinase